MVVLARFVHTEIGSRRYVGRTKPASDTTTPLALRATHDDAVKLPVSTTPNATLTDRPVAST